MESSRCRNGGGLDGRGRGGDASGSKQDELALRF
jgi:hypothetical protein